MGIGAEIVVYAWTAVTLVTLYCLLRYHHKNSSMFQVVLVIGGLNSIFSVLHVYKQYLGVLDTTVVDKFFSDEYTFSMTCFAAIVGVLSASVMLQQKSSRIIFGISLFLSLSLIIFLKKFGCFLFSKEEMVHTEQETESVLYIVLKKNSTTVCSDKDNFGKASVLLEYICIYIPVTVMFWKMLNKSPNFNEWIDLHKKEKCPGCQFTVSLGHCCVLHFLLIIWVLRPLITLISYCWDSVFFDANSTPLIAVLSINILMVWYILKKYMCWSEDSRLKCLEKNSNWENDTEIDEKILTNI